MRFQDAVTIILLLSPVSCYSITVPLYRRDPAHSTSRDLSSSTNWKNNPFHFSNVDNIRYTVQLFLDDVPYTVMLDTGSTDLWIDRQGQYIPGLTNTGINLTIQYITSEVAGPIVIGNVTLGDFSIPTQAFIDTSDEQITNSSEIQGLLGLSPPMRSDIIMELKRNNSTYNGIPFLDRIFSLHPEEPNFMTFLLSRNDAGITDGGAFTIGEMVRGYTDITKTPELLVVSPVLGAWITFMDKVVVNSVSYTGHSINNDSIIRIPKNTLSVMLDSGTPYATAPSYYVDSIYKDLPGAVFDNFTGSYIVPCDTKLNISLVFRNNSYPIHPIDATWIANVTDDGVPICESSFGYTPDDAGLDFLLGTAFMRSVYSLFDFGNWTFAGTTAPFMQLLSIVDSDKAYSEFDALNAARIEAYIQNHGGSS